jgi:putative SOS response-associated peptidase YedK
MCGRYRRTTSEKELARLYHIPIPKQTDLPISYNIAPSQKVLTRTCALSHPVGLVRECFIQKHGPEARQTEAAHRR